MESAQSHQTTCTSFKNSIISCHVYFVDGDKFESRAFDSTWKAQTFVANDEENTVFSSNFPIHNLAYERLCNVSKLDNIKFAVKIATSVPDTIELALFNSVILTSGTIIKFMESIQDAEFGSVHQLKTSCYSNNYDPRILLPLTITFRKITRGLLINSVNIIVDNKVSDALFNRFVLLYNQHKFGPAEAVIR